MSFKNESDFEKALVDLLTRSCGWKSGVLEYPTEDELLRNWANILFDNNRDIDRLNDYPLTKGEMLQIIEQIQRLKTPLKLNEFINGGSVMIIRDNKDDKSHLGKTVSLKIYDRHEIAAGQSRYQIARQPIFSVPNRILPNRRGDLMLLINGMPVIHIELKKSGIPVSQATNQIEKYAHEGVFSGLFSLVQVFVAMNPEETLYFANPGPEGRFNPDFFFHWADYNNEPISDWRLVAEKLLSIPMAHQLIGFYTVADKTDGILKVMRSYQYFAANKITAKVATHYWEEGRQRGGYVWHTTGSGKTMTSFKSAQLIANSKDADKVVFLIDRIELGTQSAQEYRGFADPTDDVQETEDTADLIAKLKSSNPKDTLIVTSIQKMYIIGSDDQWTTLKQSDLKAILKKRIVFIVDECHRNAFGDMMAAIKKSFPKALFFGFTGTPIQEENRIKGSVTADVFGNELHRYSIADGIRDKNVLGFDPIQVHTFKEKDARKAVALEKAKAATEEEVFSDPKKKKIYYKYMNDVPMTYSAKGDGTFEQGIEDYLRINGQYRTDEHRKKVVEDILENWTCISHNKKFHGLFATSSIPEAIEYYNLFKELAPDLKVTCLFDPSIDNDGGQALKKEDALKEIVEDYNQRYSQTFTIPTYGKMKKDIQNRLAHKGAYKRVEAEPEKKIDLLIVVDQMLTGYDSKWINVLYLDKLLEYQNVIQAFSRTNRLFGEDKPHGVIKYYRAPYTMQENIKAAVKLYSGDKELGLFVLKLGKNLDWLNSVYDDIESVYVTAGVVNFESLPEDVPSRQKFAKLFNALNGYLQSAKVQGFVWERLEYAADETGDGVARQLKFNKRTYLILLQRYKELFDSSSGGGGIDSPYDLKGYLTTIKTDEIDANYMNSRFTKFLKELNDNSSEELQAAKEELHKTFATLSQEEQKFANIILHEIESGDLNVEPDKTLLDYINEYMAQAKNKQIHKFADALGVDEDLLRVLTESKDVSNEFGRLNKLRDTINVDKARHYLEEKEGESIPDDGEVIMRSRSMLKAFIKAGGFDI